MIVKTSILSIKSTKNSSVFAYKFQLDSRNVKIVNWSQNIKKKCLTSLAKTSKLTKLSTSDSKNVKIVSKSGKISEFFNGMTKIIKFLDNFSNLLTFGTSNFPSLFHCLSKSPLNLWTSPPELHSFS